MSLNTEYGRPILASCFRRSLPPGENLVEGILSLRSADLSDMELTSMQGLDMCERLEAADLSGNSIRSVDATVLELLPLLRSLNLARNQIASAAALEGFTSLPKEANLQHINLSLNPVRFDLSAPLPFPQTLSVLTLDSEQVGDAGGKEAVEKACREQFPGFQALNVVEVIAGAPGADQPLPTPEEGVALQIARDAALPAGCDSLEVRFDKEHNPLAPGGPGAPTSQTNRPPARPDRPSTHSARSARVDDGSGPTQPRPTGRTDSSGLGRVAGRTNSSRRQQSVPSPRLPQKPNPAKKDPKRRGPATPQPPKALPQLSEGSGPEEPPAASRQEERSAELKRAMEDSRRRVEEAANEMKELDEIFSAVRSEIDAKIEESSRRELEAYSKGQEP